MPEEVLALDRASSRRIDQDGHLHIAVSNFSRACVSPYRGGEIPDFENLGLDANRVYQLLRPADELARAASSFNGKPLLSQHQPLSSDDHPEDLTVGAAGNDTRFEDPWLRGSLTVWRQDAIDDINSGARKHISLGYRYTPVMQPGEFEGQRYDGVMRNIAGNHITLVEQPRVPGAVVGDAAMRTETQMALAQMTERRKAAATAIHRALRNGTLAQDATIEQLNQLLASLEPSSAAGMPPGGAPPGGLPGGPGVAGAAPVAPASPVAPVDPTLDPSSPVVPPIAAQPDPMTTLSPPTAVPPDDDVVDAAPGADPNDPAGAPPGAPPEAGEGGLMDQLLDLLQANLQPDVMAQVRQIAAQIAQGAEGGEAPPDDDPGPSEPPSEPDDDKKPSEDEMPENLKQSAKDTFPKAGKPRVINGAMDAAMIQQIRADTEAAVIAKLHAVRDAEVAVQPYVGVLNKRFTDPAQVYKFALDSMNVPTKGVHPSAYSAMLALLPTADQRASQSMSPSYAMDTSVSTNDADDFQHIGRLKHAV